MNLLNEVRDYISYVRQNQYIYSLQKQGLDLFMSYIDEAVHAYEKPRGYIEAVDYFLAFWVPKHKKYLAVEEAFNIAYTMQDFLSFVTKKYDMQINTPLLLDYYGEEYMRVYKAIEIVHKLIGDPVISVSPSIVHLQSYKDYKAKQTTKDRMALYEQGVFRVEELNDEGYIVFQKISTKKSCRVLMRKDLMYHFKINDVIHCTLKRKIFFVYWEIEELKAYYPAKALAYL